MWRVTPADDDLRRDAIGLDVDDSGWAELVVPGHWRNHPEFADHDGPLLHRHRFRLPEPADGRRRWITLDGVFYQADVWLDGAYLGDPEGYFFPHTFDITALSRIGDEHVVAIEVACPAQRSHRGKRTITGVFQYWDGIDRTWNPGGIWRPVHVFDTGPVRVDRYRVLCRDADETRAHLLLSARLDSDGPRRVTLRTTVDGELAFEQERRLAAGLNEVNWSLDIADPALWWPRSLGEQPLTHHRRRGRCRRRHQRCARPPHRAPGGRVERLAVLGERRATLPEGRQPAARQGCARGRHAGRIATRHRARGRRRPRRAAGARPHRPPARVRRRRRARHAAAAGLPAAVGIRTLGPRAGRDAGPGGGRHARPPPVDRAVERAQRAGRRGRGHRGRRRARRGCGTWPASSCRRGTRPCSTAG